ncbi:hypothetical protein Bca4012_006525 [Brassica carinata]|uniref:BnaA06g38590D protein n=5 Tax=Brassica TaxID=3705 RepID=A0A078IDZ0_BRANA|nr:PREDICTED: uncharacterized protein LOC106332808 [Brassica oleracea var. oleracea]XP_013717777.1 uncharacterized protein LOC106421481 [Brassica napus]KAG2292609.1 hypothetical protein Bca52824_039278 [Brassica carinata]CAG7869880.1 unnamed protein product [Brassica rapa]KAH0893412.1 hypothetical protein HID58_055841 [Brassica napus]CAF1708952.1 unnamed protein product [Brassica napus]CDY47403.1 BnaCnng15120D [Brassica napus]
MANKATFHLLMIFCLTLSQFFFFFPTNASRFGSLMERPDQIFLPQQDTILDVKKDVEERVTMELNDYPGSGANNRHLPRGRGCIDC